MSKFSLNVLEQSVFPFFKNNDPDVLLPPEFGEDIALTRISDGVLVSHIDPIVGAVKEIGWLAVHVACNDIATSGTRPRWLLLLVLVPDQGDVALLEEIMRDAGRAADEIGASIIGGHTGYTSNLTRPLVAVTALGTINSGEPVCTRGARVGDHVFLTKGIGLEGTAILANDFEKTALDLGVTRKDLEAAGLLIRGVSIIPEALAFSENGATSMHDVTRGGLLETLLEVAKLSGTCIQVDTDKILTPEIVVRFSKAFDFDPLKMISSGTLVATVPQESLDKITATLSALGIPFADIGTVTEGDGVNMVYADRVEKFSEIRCEEDELARMWALYK